MCSIFGVLSTQNLTSELESFKAANALMNHRGPDATGDYYQNGIYLAHNRLSIIDLDPRSNQPMVKDHVTIVFNGEIYNFKELKRELSDYPFRTESDTEMLLAGYQVWGLDKLLKKIEGMFAFALLDKEKNKAFLVRDRLGKKPLFYYQEQGRILFSSEVASIKKLAKDIRLNATGLDAYLILNYSPAKEHLIERLHSVKPGHALTVDLNNLNFEEKRYWYIFENIDSRSSVADEVELEEIITQAVKKRLVADVSVCGFLSGGIDSSLIAALAQKNLDQRYRTYCIGYEGYEKFNEFEYARAVADQYNLDHHEVNITVDQAKKLLFEYVEKLDEPISNWVWVPLYFLSKQLHDDGHKVVLVGEGADELFFGYNSMTKSLSALNGQNQMLDKFNHYLFGGLSGFTSQGHRSFDKWFRSAKNLPSYMGTSFFMTHTQRNMIAGKQLLEKSQNSLAGYAEILRIQNELKKDSGNNYDNVDLISYTEIYSKMIEVLVRRVDRITMLNSIEARAPFLDHKLIEFVFKTMGSARIEDKNKKAWLKKVARKHIPDQCIDRKKMGFSFPFKEWLQEDLGNSVFDYFQDAKIFQDEWLNKDYVLKLLDQHRKGQRDNSPKIWSFFTLAKWYEKLLV